MISIVIKEKIPYKRNVYKGFLVAQTEQISKHFLEDLERLAGLNSEVTIIEL